MDTTHDEGKSVVAERLLTILKNSISKNTYIEKLHEIVN